MLGHKVPKKGIKVDKAKVDLISNLHMPSSMKQVGSFLGHADFYRGFIKDFSKVAHPLTNLVTKDAPFVIDEFCVKTFENLLSLLMSAPIVQSPNFSLAFEIMCDASNFAIGAVLGQRVNRMPHFILSLIHI